jgi:antitoxin (DNA-binding transcriptional repressor) of toxin-antitoxin stability system
MTHIQLSDLRTHCKDIFDKVVAGQTFLVMRRGRPVAEILPFHEHVQRQGWKRNVKKVCVTADHRLGQAAEQAVNKVEVV